VQSLDHQTLSKKKGGPKTAFIGWINPYGGWLLVRVCRFFRHTVIAL